MYIELIFALYLATMKSRLLAVCIFLGGIVPCSDVKAQDTTKLAAAAAELPVPSFKAEAANEGLAQYKAIMDELGPRLARNDASVFTEFSTRISAWSTTSQIWMKLLSKEEQDQLNAYLNYTAKKYTPSAPAIEKSQH
jgi:transposase-like protein